VLFMNSDVELAPGCIAAALHRLNADSMIGAVGGKVVRTHGLLQEAGSILWRDGGASGYLRDASQLAPEAEFVRDVDFCSGVFLLVRGAPLRALGGFDAAFAPAYYEDADLCVRLWQAGYRVVYDPAVQLTHYEHGSARSADAPQALMEQHRKIFCRKHRAWLKQRHAPSARSDVFARSAGAPKSRVLFIEDTVPLRGTGSGYVRANDILRSMVALGYEVTVFPMNGCRFEIARAVADLPDTVEIMHDCNIGHLAEFLERRPGYYDAIWVSRAHNLDKARPALERTYPDPNRVSIILDTEAVFALRAAVRAAMTGAAFDLDRALDREFANAWLCQRVVAVSEAEAEVLRRHGLSDVAVLGTMREPTPTPRRWQERAGLLFVGSVHATDSPNYDSLCWFIDEVLPLLREQIGTGARLTIAGYTAPGVSLGRWRGHPDVELLGAIEDLVPLYDRHRVFVAPTRFAAGVPYKVCEAAGYGLPVVASELLCRQLGWADGTEIMAGDVRVPARFAGQIARLYRSPEPWHRLRTNAAARLARENAPADYRERLSAILAPLPPPRAASVPLRPTLVPESRYPAAAE
jgi:glycosyltransferase involved in cell wall biosynthesis